MAQAGALTDQRYLMLKRRGRVVASYKGSARPIGHTLRKIAWSAAITFALGLVAAGIASAYIYNYYAAIVETRVATGFWHSRGGVYAAPYKLRVGMSASPEAVVEQLRRSGYVEGSDVDGIWNGRFSYSGKELSVTPSAAVNTKGSRASIKFSGDRITAISLDGKETKEYAIEPEMLIGRT